jgi:hemerythrin superfamily protein
VEMLIRAYKGLAAVLADHNQKEERTLFPFLDRMLPEEERWAILRRLLLF